ncbi:hypothetical protein EVAR_65330_1 [Eumeta japonica]|uniref:Uncharacterized protein n=1 Tax=Eumeta variegata TaxID=151549 RepID=A0A4C1YUG5_EUMVA|nr:hypothetical protein EVAR_65330_1 [Eumeta japonica]
MICYDSINFIIKREGRYTSFVCFPEYGRDVAGAAGTRRQIRTPISVGNRMSQVVGTDPPRHPARPTRATPRRGRPGRGRGAETFNSILEFVPSLLHQFCASLAPRHGG